jgi:hypothetical protein
LPSSCHIIVTPVTVVVLPIALLVPPVAVVMPPIVVLPLDVVVPRRRVTRRLVQLAIHPIVWPAQ